MIKLLVSVRSVEEAKLAIEAGADLIDLKDPDDGALGALDDMTVESIMQSIPQYVVVSTTIGDEQSSAEILLELVERKAKLGVDIVKLPVSHHLLEPAIILALSDMQKTYGIKLIAVLNASYDVDLTWVKKLHDAGFYGAMLDTFDKSKSLVHSQHSDFIKMFVKQCKKHQLYVGLAGALKQGMLDGLVQYDPDYLGFRSGVCENNLRKNKLVASLVKKIKQQLHKHNILVAKLNNINTRIA